MAYQRKVPIDFEKLIARSEAARSTLSEARLELKHKFDLVGRAKDALTSGPAMLVGGSLIGGFLLKKIFSKKSPKRSWRRSDHKIKELKTERGLLVGLFAIMLAVAKPVAKVYGTKLLKDYLKNRFERGAVPRHRPIAGNLPPR